MTTTIAAVATGPAVGAIGVIRVSGPAALRAARRVAKDLPAALVARHAYVTELVDAKGRVVDQALALFFPGPKSATGEDVVELHAHGAPRLLRLVLELLLAEDGVRLAEPGEFTRRAFLNGRLDLARAEAVADLIAARSEAAVRAAAAQLSGQLSDRVDALRRPLLDLLADLEGVLDFPDEADGADANLAARIDALLEVARSLARDGHSGAVVRRGARVVLYGPVNAGKSTLFNRLVGADRALVDPEPGTTRDALEGQIEVGGVQVTFVDTAGLRDEPGRLEGLGIERTRAALREADLAVLLAPADERTETVTQWRREVPDHLRLDVASKADLGGSTWNSALAVSGLQGDGVEALRAALSQRLFEDTIGAVAFTSERHLEALGRAAESIARARQALEVSTLEVVAGELGLALRALADITGGDVSTELLDTIFQRFCIGK